MNTNFIILSRQKHQNNGSREQKEDRTEAQLKRKKTRHRFLRTKKIKVPLGQNFFTIKTQIVRLNDPAPEGNNTCI